MLLKVKDIPEGGLRFSIKDKRRSIVYGERNIPLIKPFSGFMEINRRDGGRVIVEGSFTVSLRLVCSRCLEEFEYTIMESFRDVYFPSSFCFDHGVHELSKDDLDVLYYANDEIDLSMVYLEKTYLSIPMKPLCSEDCRGICPICGKNLNYGECDCNKRPVDPRWQQLLAIKEKLMKG